MREPRPKSFGSLILEVVRPGICTSCGACIAVCPERVLQLEGETPTIRGKCTVCQVCYFSCPRASFDSKDIEEAVFGRERSEAEELGVMVEARFARALDPETARVGQDGGAVTAILDSLVRTEKMDCAVVSTWDKNLPWKPFPTVAKNREEIILGAGTKYTPSPTLTGLQEAVQDLGGRRVAVVGTPCQARAIRRIQTSNEISSKIIPEELFIIGLFCMESYGYESLIGKYLPSQGVDPAEVTKFSIKKGRFIAHSNGTERINVPLKEVKSQVRTSCDYCRDFTAEFADLSVGSVDAPSGWSTLILRNEKALTAILDAEEKGLLETRKISKPEEELRVTRRLSARKSRHPEKPS